MTHQDVLIIGAGPSGLFAAAELARHGVIARIIERDLQPHRQARATGIQPGTLEILDSVGLLPAFLESSEHILCARMYGPNMVELGAMRMDGIDCRCRMNCSLPQYETQRILEAHLISLGGKVERGVTATRIETEATGVVVDLTHADGRVETVHPGYVIGAGGAHSITRHSMNEKLQGDTYRGNFLVADFAMTGPIPRNEAGVICGPNGLLLLAPMPGGRWISFQDLEEDIETVTPEQVITRTAERLDGKHRPTDVSWHSPFRMHRRIVSRQSDGRRFLIGDAAHLSSPFGGEGLNSGLHDGYDLAWKLALVLHGQARPLLLDHYAVERQIADRHVLEVSDHVHQSIVEVANATRQRREVHASTVDPVAAAMMVNARAMIDVDYAGSPLVVDYSEGSAGPHPGQRFPDWCKLAGTLHHVLVFGPDAPAKPLTQRWAKLVRFSHNPSLDPVRAGIPNGGVAMIRPDGHIGFRFPCTTAEAFTALDRHLASYLFPETAAGQL